MPRMPTLLELQRAMRAGLIDRKADAIAASLAEGVGADRLDIYRNTILFGLTRALRLAFPGVERLVGHEFFDGAADVFIREHLPSAACLDRYGSAFPEFLRRFAPAASLTYLADVADLEWAVTGALHAPDATPLQLEELAEIARENQGAVKFRPHPSLGLIRAEYPADDIWRAVLAGDDQALAALDLGTGPVFLLVERAGAVGDVEVSRMPEAAWRFLRALCDGELLLSATETASGLDVANQLAAHLAAGRFAGFSVLAHDEHRHEAAA
jgi:putative DNA-binding protein